MAPFLLRTVPLSKEGSMVCPVECGVKTTTPKPTPPRSERAPPRLGSSATCTLHVTQIRPRPFMENLTYPSLLSPTLLFPHVAHVTGGEA